MRRSRFTEKQIIGILRDWDTGSFRVGEIADRYGVSRETFYYWKRRRESLRPSPVAGESGTRSPFVPCGMLVRQFAQLDGNPPISRLGLREASHLGGHPDCRPLTQKDVA